MSFEANCLVGTKTVCVLHCCKQSTFHHQLSGFLKRIDSFFHFNEHIGDVYMCCQMNAFQFTRNPNIKAAYVSQIIQVGVNI